MILYIVDAAEHPTSTFTTRPLSELKCEVMPHHAEASFQRLIILVSLHNLSRVSQYLSLLPVVSGEEIHTAEGLHNPRTPSSLFVLHMAQF
jgi:hypothetical protein